MTTAYTTADVAKLLRISPDKVRALIAAGLIRAIDVSTPGAKRPQWRIAQTALEQFQQVRANRTPPPRQTRRRRQPGVIEFYR